MHTGLPCRSSGRRHPVIVARSVVGEATSTRERTRAALIRVSSTVRLEMAVRTHDQYGRLLASAYDARADGKRGACISLAGQGARLGLEFEICS